MISIRLALPGRPMRGADAWPAVVAAVLTWTSFAAVSYALRLPAAGGADATAPPAPVDERVTYVAPTVRTPARPTPRADAAVPHARRAPVPMPTPASPVSPPPRDTALRAAAAARSDAMSPVAVPSRLLPPAPPGTPWYSAPRGRNPFAPAELLTAEARDSVVSAIGGDIVAAAARRAPTQAERDSAAKAAMLKMRLSGRTLLVPPDNSGGLITARIPLPFLSAGRPRAVRERDARAANENRARLARLRERADSARRARGDSVPE